MKKIILGLILIVTTISAFFYQEILGTKDWLIFQQDNSSIFTQATITWKPIPFTSTGNSGLASETLTFNKLQLPVPFSANIKEGLDSAFALGAVRSINITHSDETKDFFTDNNFSNKEKAETCQFLSSTSGIGACTSEYNLYRSFLELNETDIHLFSSISDKQNYNRLITIRSSTLESNTVSAFETRTVMGFLFTIDSKNYIANIFDSSDQMYKVTFSNMDKSDVSFVLSNTVYLK